ncbi:hypothetical protein Pint_09744 [Pistacia integerrima]|uniref:Uncharacterized protein n=1 Tax=Pistacia integerrima TaxID=434235 RepID=A0ACC0XFQ7_9ROSI|nr:hypothetical protein Pint_09744 [Pistacia integerrima]
MGTQYLVLVKTEDELLLTVGDVELDCDGRTLYDLNTEQSRTAEEKKRVPEQEEDDNDGAASRLTVTEETSRSAVKRGVRTVREMVKGRRRDSALLHTSIAARYNWFGYWMNICLVLFLEELCKWPCDCVPFFEVMCILHTAMASSPLSRPVWVVGWFLHKAWTLCMHYAIEGGAGTYSGKPRRKVTIANSGEKPKSKWDEGKMSLLRTVLDN